MHKKNSEKSQCELLNGKKKAHTDIETMYAILNS